jgi:NADH-quinone oxidoreductase subunit G
MEGLNRGQPAALLPFVWAPGWNSNQSLHKFQAPAASGSRGSGTLRGGTAGVRLLAPAQRPRRADAATPPAFEPVAGQWQLVPRYRIFGSEELSAFSPGIAELVAPACIEINTDAARELGVSDGDGVQVGDGLATLQVRVNDCIAGGCAGYSAGHEGTWDLRPGSSVTLRRAEGWQDNRPGGRRDDLIGSDGGDRD